MTVKIVYKHDPHRFELFGGVTSVSHRLNKELDDFEVTLHFTDSRRDEFSIILNEDKAIYIMNEAGKTVEKVLSYHTALMAN